MKYLSRVSGVVFGASMILLSVMIVAEILLRKFFAFSLGGVDELGGYAVAIVAPLAFIVTAAESAHIRINLLHARLPERARGILNLAASVSLALLALFLFYFTVKTVEETLAYRSIAQTPWATPLIFPQAVWLLTMGAFALGTVILALSACMAAARRDWGTLDRRFGPESVADEVQTEIDDLKKRQGASS